MAKTEREMIGGAFERARGRQALVRFLTTSAGGFDVYAVGSTADVDQAYTVTVKGSEFKCTCPAEQRVACWHRAAVYVRRANDRARAEHEARVAAERVDVAALFAA
jgi:activator of HSP90 ATPase